VGRDQLKIIPELAGQSFIMSKIQFLMASSTHFL